MKLKTKKTSDEISKSGFGKALGLSPGRVTQLISLGLPVTPNGRIPLTSAKEWYRNQIRSGARKRGPRTAKAQNRRSSNAAERLLAAQADRAESMAVIAQLEAQRRRGELLEAPVVADAWSSVIVAAKNHFLYVGGKLGPRVAAIADPIECTQIINGEIRRCLQTLSEHPLGEEKP